jgi:hypothetical protein
MNQTGIWSLTCNPEFQGRMEEMPSGFCRRKISKVKVYIPSQIIHLWGSKHSESASPIFRFVEEAEDIFQLNEGENHKRSLQIGVKKQ